MCTIDDGVYVLKNKASQTYLDLDRGNSADGATVVGWQLNSPMQYYLYQHWLIQYDPEIEAYTFQNAWGGTFLDLKGGKGENGTPVQGYARSQNPRNQNQLWLIEGPAADKTYRIIKKGTNASMEVGGGDPSNGAGINVWATQENNTNQAWLLERRDRYGFHIEELLSDNPFIRQQFQPFKAGVRYLLCPQKVMEDLCEKRGILQKKGSESIYDSDDRAYSLRAAVGEWARDNVKIKVVLVCGIMYGTLTGGNRDAKYAYNWTPTHDWSSIIFFEPETGRFLENIGYHAYLCLL